MRRIITFAVLALLALTAFACGDSDGGGDETAASGETQTETADGAAEAKKRVEAGSAFAEWTSPGPPVDASTLSGKTAAYVPIISTISFTQQIYETGFKPAMEAAGVKPVFFSTDATPAAQLKATLQAVAQKVDVIVTQAIDLGLVGPGIKAANEAKIPVIESISRNLGEDPSPGAAALVAYRVEEAGRLMADYAVASTNGELNGVVFSSTTSSAASEAQIKGMEAEIAELCPDTCSLKFMPVAASEWATKLPLLVRTALTKDPNVNFLFPLYDDELPYVVPAVKAAGAIDKVGIATFNGSPPMMKYVASGDVEANVGDPLHWLGYAYADQAFRLMAGMEPAPTEDAATPLRLFTKDNFDSAMLDEPTWKWYTETDVFEDYKGLWNLK
jgi:ribose transport system substrate-binding protein